MLPTWDLVLLVFFAASVIYGFLMGKDKILATILGAYVGLVIANQWGARVFDLVSNQTGVLNTGWMHGSLSIFIVKVVLFAIVLLVVAMRGNLMPHLPGIGNNNGIFNLAVPFIHSVLSAALIASSILDFLPADTRSQVIEKSIVAAPLVAYYSWWLILPVLLMMISGWFSKE